MSQLTVVIINWVIMVRRTTLRITITIITMVGVIQAEMVMVEPLSWRLQLLLQV